jgi:hypothetical protein
MSYAVMEHFSELQVAFGTIFRVVGSYLNTGTSFLKRVTEFSELKAIS